MHYDFNICHKTSKKIQEFVKKMLKKILIKNFNLDGIMFMNTNCDFRFTIQHLETRLTIVYSTSCF